MSLSYKRVKVQCIQPFSHEHRETVDSSGFPVHVCIDADLLLHMLMICADKRIQSSGDHGGQEAPDFLLRLGKSALIPLLDHRKAAADNVTEKILRLNQNHF